jgi:hypothetical protein
MYVRSKQVEYEEAYCDCGPSKFDFRDSATFRSLMPIPLLSSPFSSAQDGFKNQQKIF